MRVGDMLTDELVKEELSYAYVHSIATSIGLLCETTGHIDRASVDARIQARGPVSLDSIFNSPTINIQLKATSHCHIENGKIIFDLPVKNYNDLRAKTLDPNYLVLLILPEDENEWVHQSTEHIISKKCAYWAGLHGCSETNNTSTVRIKIPELDIFTKDVLKEMIIKASKLEVLKNVSQ